MRFIFCACSISYMLNDWSGVDVENAVKYIQDSLVRGSLHGESLLEHYLLYRL